MSSTIQLHSLKRARLPCTSCTSSTPFQHIQVRHATLLRRPLRPYTFTQLVTLSDGSTYLHRTTSPLPMYKSAKDTRNHAMWQPSLDSLRNVEEDEAGKLRAFREKFGRGWDAEGKTEEDENGKEEEEDSLMDLISDAGADIGTKKK